MSELQLEVGKSYLDREGEIHKIIHIESDSLYPFVDNHDLSYTATGRHLIGAETVSDLISECTIHSVSPVVQPDTITFATGAVRSADRAKQRYDLISPIGLRRVAETCHEGATKYSPYNWEKGMGVSEMLNHAIPHIYAYLSGDRSEDHLAHAAWNLLGAMHSEELWPHLNDNLRSEGCVPPVEKPVVTA